MGRQAAISTLHNAGFTVAMVAVPSDQPAGTVIAQDPRGGSKLVQTGTVTITVANGEAPSPSP
jgi:eukaryotic-like serine/threonine-protein kinase